MEKTKNKKWYHYLIIYILGFIIYTSMVLTITNCINNKKAGAYTNNVVSYANVTDLTNTTWVFKNTINFSSVTSDITYNINFVSNNTNYNEFTLLKNDNIIMFNQDYIYDEIAGFYEIYKTITITGGTDANNSNLINFIQINAEQEIGNTEEYTITYNLQNVLIIGNKPTQISNLEEINLEVQNFNNYELPQNIMVENASYNWNYETGILTIYDAIGNVNITIRAEYISGNYSFIELIDSVILIPLNTFFNLFNFELFGVNIYALLTATLTLFVIIKILLKVFK